MEKLKEESKGCWEMVPTSQTIMVSLQSVESDVLRSLFNNPSTIKPAEVVRYGAGYVACAVIAILFLIFMLVFGIIYCVFQCRGERIFKRCEGMFCHRVPVFLLLFLTCTVLLAGVICTFCLNQKVQEEFAPGVYEVTDSLQRFRSSIDNLPLVLEKISSDFSIPKQKVLDELQSFGPDINRTLSAKLNQEIYPLLQDSYQTAKQLKEAAQAVVDVNVAVKLLQKSQSKLVAELSSHRQNLERTLSDTQCKECKEAAAIVPQLQQTANYSQIPSLDDYVKKLTQVRKINLTGIFLSPSDLAVMGNILMCEFLFFFIPETKKALDTIEGKINSLISSVPIQQYTEPIHKALLEAEEKSAVYGKEAERYEYYRWVIGITLCCVLLLITICTFLGLLLGVWYLYLQQDGVSSNLRQTGYLLLKGEVYVSFCFSWLLIILVYVTFLVGGNVQTLLCEPWANGEIYSFLDDPNNLPPSVSLSNRLGLREDVNISYMYQLCKEGAPIWDVLQVDDPTGMLQSINITQYTAEIQNKVNNFTVDLSGLTIMTIIAIKTLYEYSHSGIEKVPYDAMLAQIQPPLVTLDLGHLASMLKSLATVQNNDTIRTQLQNEANALGGIQNGTVREQNVHLSKLNDSLHSLAEHLPNMQANINHTIENIRSLQDTLIGGIIQLLKNESTCLLRKAIAHFTQYLDWVTKLITEDVSSCQSVPRTLDNIHTVVCDNITNPWNGFWFCLAWCTFFLIPNILLSIKSVEHFSLLKPISSHSRLEEENPFPLTGKSHPFAVQSIRTSEIL
uniref:Prominin 2 n=1 Tax=Xenopus tropicalis TaxID=8364 RepID=A0A6I8QE27_XENTR